MNYRPVDILIVEDNESERTSIVASLQETIPDVQVVAVHNCEEALNYLSARGDRTARDVAISPKLILLDLALTGVDGLSLLKKIRSLDQQEDPMMCTPVIIYSDLQTSNDITESYRYGANSFIVKPSNFNEFQADLTAAAQYWLTVRKRISNKSHKKSEYIPTR